MIAHAHLFDLQSKRPLADQSVSSLLSDDVDMAEVVESIFAGLSDLSGRHTSKTSPNLDVFGEIVVGKFYVMCVVIPTSSSADLLQEANTERVFSHVLSTL